jgi:2-succinyl-5-enolpyruvyl-6-hydroxy-3-cyclohexene-1-carboxylate synthase
MGLGGVTDPTPSSASTVQATFCATLVDEWVRGGVTLAVVAPGSRSTPLALALAADDRIRVQVHHDERCAAFIALGHGVATGVPALAVCTSGTAATHFHAAAVEAHHASVPLILCTADRPPELQGVGAPQTIDQTNLYGRAVRWFCDPGPPTENSPPSWRTTAATALTEAATGPVHLNLPFREPLVAEPGVLPPPSVVSTSAGGRPPVIDPTTVGALTGRRGVVVAGRGAGTTEAIAAVAETLGWPVLADPVSGYDGPASVHHADAILRGAAIAAELRPEAVLRLGAPPASKVLGAYLADPDAVTVHVGHAADPARVARASLPGDAWAVGAALHASGAVAVPADWCDRWRALEARAEAAIAQTLALHPEPTEPGTARTLLAALPSGSHLVVASSMPVRDLEWYATPRADVHVHSNRGVNGIDGVVSTAIGVALGTGATTACLLGDVALLHDSNALIGIADRGIDLTIVVVDNDGGGIFSFLPQATSLPAPRFEQLFGTPHGVRPEALAAVHGLPTTTIEYGTDLVLEVANAGRRRPRRRGAHRTRRQRRPPRRAHRRRGRRRGRNMTVHRCVVRAWRGPVTDEASS